MTVTELSARMPAKEFDQWKDYYVLEPFGQERDNWHMGRLASLYMQVHGKKGTVSSVEDFMYRTEAENKDRSTKAVLTAMAAMAKPKENSNGCTGKTCS